MQNHCADSIVWSHYHWDHTGNVSLFPRSTGIVVGPGLKETPNLLPGFPQNPDGYLAAEYFAGRALTQIDFDKEDDFIIGGYRAHDFFGDGSFYLLGTSAVLEQLYLHVSDLRADNRLIDTPGHCIGHMCGLARTTGGPDSTFILMGGDIAHFAGDLRPHPKIPLPAILPEGVLDDDLANFPVPCPCSVFTDHHPLINHGLDKGDRQQTPFYNVSTGPVSSYIDPATSQQSVDTLKAFDASDSVLVCLSHDGALLRYLPTLNQSPEETMNNWKQLGWKSRCHWDWLNELPRKSKPGRAPIVDGYWKNGRPWLDAKDALMEGASVALAKAMEA